MMAIQQVPTYPGYHYVHIYVINVDDHKANSIQSYEMDYMNTYSAASIACKNFNFFN